MSDHELPRIQENATKKELEDIVDRFLREVDSVDLRKGVSVDKPTLRPDERKILASEEDFERRITKKFPRGQECFCGNFLFCDIGLIYVS